MNEEDQKIAKYTVEWLVTSEDKGLSSEFMAHLVLTSIFNSKKDLILDTNHPLDTGDFKRCLLFVRAVPGVKKFFSIIAKTNNEWKNIIENWDLLEDTYISEMGINWKKINKFRPIKTREILDKLIS
jgi:hypothetical protein